MEVVGTALGGYSCFLTEVGQGDSGERKFLLDKGWHRIISSKAKIFDYLIMYCSFPEKGTLKTQMKWSQSKQTAPTMAEDDNRRSFWRQAFL